MGDGPALSLALEPIGVAASLVEEWLGLARSLGHRHRRPGTLFEHLDPDQLDAEEHRAGILGPDRLEPDPCPGELAAIEIEVDQGIERGPVLEVERPAGPAAQEFLEIGIRLRHLVRGELDHHHVEGGQRRGGIQVAAFLGFPVEHGPASPELGELTLLHERPEDEIMSGIALPGDARAMVAE